MTKETLGKSFSISRTALLMRNRAFEDFPAIAIAMGILLGINVLGIVLGGRAVMNDSEGQTWEFFIGVTGLLLAGMAFKGMHEGRSGTDWILLPATSLEKYSSALISYLLVFPIAAGIAATGLSAFLSLVETLAGGPGGRIWSPLLAGFEGWTDYATGALVLAAGSAAFRKRAVLKTFGLSVAYVLAAAGLLLGAVLFVRNARGLPVPGFVLNDGDISMIGDFSIGAEPAVDLILGVVRYALVPLFALLYGYFRVAEKEARDEVQ